MLNMVRNGKLLLALLLSVVFITGCGSEISVTQVSTLTIAPPQNPYQAKSSTPDAPTATFSIPTEQPLLPTPTPFKHSIQSGDTLFGIALQYNISLDRLVSANPGVNTSILTIGTELVIPFSEDDDLVVPTPTPYPIPITEPFCYSARTVGAWCILMAENDQDIVLENISVAVNIYDSSRTLVSSYAAIPPLNYLFPDQTLPLAVYLDTKLPESFQASSVLLTSLPSGESVQLTEIKQQFFHYRDDNKIADITGTVITTDNKPKGKQIWIAAVAFNDGKPIGIRKWISTQDLVTDTEISFEFVLYSLGPRIDKILLFSELH
jgi:LysM repeat protein